MVGTPSRRAVLGTAGAAITGAFAGCALNNPEVAGGHLFVENMLSEGYRISLTVTEGTDRDGDRIIDDWYRVPQNHALQFQEVIQAGTAYTVTVHRPTVASEDQVTVTVPTCDGDGEASRDVSVRVRPDGMGIIPWGCDEDYTRRELEYVDPGEYTVDPPQETATTTET